MGIREGLLSLAGETRCVMYRIAKMTRACCRREIGVLGLAFRIWESAVYASSKSTQKGSDVCI